MYPDKKITITYNLLGEKRSASITEEQLMDAVAKVRGLMRE